MSKTSEPKDDKSNKNEKIVIKKYANRRLYNTNTSKYIVLTDVLELINDGTDFSIVDAKSGEDITRSILNQIIFEQETKPANSMFPLEFQKQLIRMYSDSYGKMFPDFLTQSIGYFNAERSQMQKAFQDIMGANAGSLMTKAQDMARKNIEMFQKSWDVFGIMEQMKNNEQSVADEEPTPKNEKTKELDEIQAQIDALQERLKSMK